MRPLTSKHRAVESCRVAGAHSPGARPVRSTVVVPEMARQVSPVDDGRSLEPHDAVSA